MNLPKFMIRQTGGFAVGAISTRSRLASRAFSSASDMGTTPRGSPASPMRRTSFHRICSLTRMFFLSIFHLRDRTPLSLLLVDGAPRRRGEFFDGHRPGVAAVAPPDRDGPRGRFLLTDDEHGRHLRELR